MKFPKHIGQCADQLYDLRAKRLKAEKEVEAMKALETALREHIIKELPKSKASGVAGKHARVKIEIKEVPQPKDWNKLYKFIAKKKRFDLLQRRLANKAVMDMFEEGSPVPGVEVFKTPTVSCEKV